MRADNGRIELEFFPIALDQLSHNALLDACVAPAIESRVDGVPFAKMLGRITPRDAGLLDKEDGTNEEAIIRGSCTAVACFAAKQSFDPFVLCVARRMTCTRHCFFLQKSTIDC